MAPHPTPSKIHAPLDLDLIRGLFDHDTTNDTVPDEHQLNANPPPPIPASSHRKNARKRPVPSPTKQAGSTSQFQRTKRFKGGEGPLPSDTDVMSSGVSPMHSLSTPLPPATQAMVSVP